MRVYTRLLGVNCFFECVEWAFEVSAEFVCKVRAFRVLRVGSMVAFWHLKCTAVLKTSVSRYGKTNVVTNSVFDEQEKVFELWYFEI